MRKQKDMMKSDKERKNERDSHKGRLRLSDSARESKRLCQSVRERDRERQTHTHTHTHSQREREREKD